MMRFAGAASSSRKLCKSRQEEKIRVTGIIILRAGTIN
jgi:hypothetical protein